MPVLRCARAYVPQHTAPSRVSSSNFVDCSRGFSRASDFCTAERGLAIATEEARAASGIIVQWTRSQLCDSLGAAVAKIWTLRLTLWVASNITSVSPQVHGTSAAAPPCRLDKTVSQSPDLGHRVQNRVAKSRSWLTAPTFHAPRPSPHGRTRGGRAARAGPPDRATFSAAT